MARADQNYSPRRGAFARRLDVMARIVLAIPLGYAFISLWAFALARALPLARADASLVATMVSFAIYAAVAVWTFAARSAARAAIGLAIAVVPATLVIGLGVGA